MIQERSQEVHRIGAILPNRQGMEIHFRFSEPEFKVLDTFGCGAIMGATRRGAAAVRRLNIPSFRVIIS